MNVLDDRTSLEGPVERVDGRLTLVIPLAAGGCEFIRCTSGISEVDGEDLKIKIPDRLAVELGIREGSLVQVDNENGKFNIRPVPVALN
jgi:hypothetical protein